MKIKANSFSQPTSDFLEIEINEYDFYRNDNSIKIYNILGNCVLTDSFSNDHPFNPPPFSTKKQINISTLPAGVYFIRYGTHQKSFLRIGS